MKVLLCALYVGAFQIVALMDNFFVSGRGLNELRNARFGVAN
jgi:hypothetical protein